MGEPEARQVSYEIELANAAEKDRLVHIEEVIPGDWKIVDSTHRFKKDSSRRAVFAVTVPAGKTLKLAYTARIE